MLIRFDITATAEADSSADRIFNRQKNIKPLRDGNIKRGEDTAESGLSLLLKFEINSIR